MLLSAPQVLAAFQHQLQQQLIQPLMLPCRPIQRFWVLETVARIPYFAYISILHLYESLGFWRAGADLRRIHFAEEWNELHHLQVSHFVTYDLFYQICSTHS